MCPIYPFNILGINQKTDRNIYMVARVNCKKQTSKKESKCTCLSLLGYISPLIQEMRNLQETSDKFSCLSYINQAFDL